MAIKLAAITDEISQELEHALDVMGEYGATGAELRGLWGVNIADLNADQVRRARQAIQARNMTVVGLATPFYKCDLFDRDAGEAAGPLHLAPRRGLEEQIDLLRRCIRLADEFETGMLRIFSFWRKEAPSPAIEDRIVAALEEPVTLAEKAGLILVLENEHACFAGTGVETARIVSRIASPHLRICWDPGNAFTLGELPYPDGYQAAKPWMAHVHVKDARMVDTPDHGLQARWCVIGEGDIDYAGQFAALQRDGYDGYVSLETHFVPPTGTGPDGKGTPEDGSRPCLAYLRQVIAS